MDFQNSGFIGVCDTDWIDFNTFRACNVDLNKRMLIESTFMVSSSIYLVETQRILRTDGAVVESSKREAQQNSKNTKSQHF